MESKSVRCDLCGVELPSASLLPVHNEGKKHQRKLEKRNMLEAISERSVYVCGVPKQTFVGWEQIENVFSQFGLVDKIRIDITKGTYAIIEFEEKASADRALSAGTIKIGEHTAVIKKRKVDFDQYNQHKYEQKIVSIKYVAEEISKVNRSFNQEIDCLTKLFYLNEEQIAERLMYAKELTVALRNYFTDEAHVYIFGSTATSVGTKDSDIDATILFGEESLEVRCNPTILDRNKYTLMTCSADTLKNHKIRPTELCRLTSADRIRFMSKVLSDAKRCQLAPISNLFLILDARCPLLRFTYKRNCIIDLTVDNRLGIAKTSWISELIKADSSSTLRRFLIAVRFWAVYHNLMGKKSDEVVFAANTNGHLNAYILNILSICFFQYKQLIPPLQRGLTPITVKKWDIDFTVQKADFQDLQLSTLIKEFFVWFILQKIKDHVFCPRLGTILTLNEFCEVFPSLSDNQFKISRLNIQDPIELVHNISQLLSEKDIASIRKKMVFSLSSLKQKPHSYSSLLFFAERHNTPSDCDFEISLSLKPDDSINYFDKVRDVLTEVLCFEEIVEPELKRSRMTNESFHTVTFEINSPVWLGRRRIKRSVFKQNQTLNTWELEKLVSKTIKSEMPTSGPIKVLLRLTVHQKSDSLLLSFERLSDDDLQFHDIVHFLSQFFPNFFSRG
uniref:RRM domain-containing protein n=1 Tax=Syphacia muris TaxID=451379 RepID=A0A0N5APJ1_9BILA